MWQRLLCRLGLHWWRAYPIAGGSMTLLICRRCHVERVYHVSFFG